MPVSDRWLEETKKLLSTGQLEPAYDAALARLSKNKADCDGWALMALVALEGGNATKAIELSDKAIGYGSDDVRMLLGRSKALLTLGRHDDARDLALGMLGEPPKNALDADTLGVVLARTGRHTEAVPLFEIAVSMQSNIAQFWYNLATSLQFVGQLSGATKAYNNVLKLEPDFHRARLALVQLVPQSEDDLNMLTKQFPAASKNSDDALLIGHAAAKISEDLNAHDLALQWLHKAKRLKHLETKHDRKWVDRLYAAAKNPSILNDDAAKDADGSTHATPIFVIGMPRSGTTLIDRILSSHSQINSAGELSDLALLLKQNSKTAGSYVLDPETLTANYSPRVVGNAYRQRTESFANGASFFIDKMPFNFFYVRHIMRCLPEAKIIMLRRDARDTVFANYRQLFATDFGYYNYAYDLEDTAHFVASFNDLADHWQSEIPGARYTEIHYEHLVANQEAESRRLVDFVGLEWDPACLNFHKNEAPVATASSVQVRSPIHSGSIGRWKRYGTDGQRVEQLLNKYGVSNFA